MHRILEGISAIWYKCALEDEEDLISHLRLADFKVNNTALDMEEIRYSIFANPKLNLERKLFLGHIKADYIIEKNKIFLIVEKSSFFGNSEFKRLKKFAENYQPPSYQKILPSKS